MEIALEMDCAMNCAMERSRDKGVRLRSHGTLRQSLYRGPAAVGENMEFGTVETEIVDRATKSFFAIFAAEGRKAGRPGTSSMGESSRFCPWLPCTSCRSVFLFCGSGTQIAIVCKLGQSANFVAGCLGAGDDLCFGNEVGPGEGTSKRKPAN